MMNGIRISLISILLVGCASAPVTEPAPDFDGIILDPPVIMDPPLDESINSALADVNNGSDDPTEQEVLLQLPRGIN